MNKDFQSFLDYLLSEKRYSRHTITSYRNDLSQFAAYFEENYSLNKLHQVKTTHIRSWMVHLKERSLSNRTIHRKISSLKSLFKYLMRYHKLQVDPTKKVILPKLGKQLPQFVDEKSMDSLFNYYTNLEDFVQTRDILIIEILYTTGIRLSELIGLKWEDINEASSMIKVFGKRNKERLIPVPKQLMSHFHYYKSQRQTFFKYDDSPYVIVTNKGKKSYEKLIYRVVKTILGEFSTINKKSPHVLRHSIATHLSNNGVDILAIKEILGHANLTATQVYTHNSIEKLKKVYKNTHPKS